MDTLNNYPAANAFSLFVEKLQHAAIRVCLIFALAVWSSHILMAQINIAGEIKTRDQQPIPFANILLLQPQDSSLVVGTISNEDGAFSLNVRSGDYIINISMIGYRPFFSPIGIKATVEKVHFNTYYLSEDIKRLDEIVVSGQKPLFEKQIDRTIVNVQSSITSAGSSILQVLEKSPGVIVNRQNNSIALNGKTGVLVMINEKMSRLPMDAVVQMLQGMSSANVDKIELITTPPARYDAEGDAGIIHIVMKENPDLGVNGNFGVTAGYNRGETLGFNFNLSKRTKNLNTFLNYSIHHDRNIHEWISEWRQPIDGFNQIVLSDSYRKPLTTVQNLQAGAEYEFNDKTSASLLVTGYRRKWKMDAITTNSETLAQDAVVLTEMSIFEVNKWQSATGSLGLKHRFDDHQEIILSYDYLYYHNDNPSSYNNSTSSPATPGIQSEYLEVEKLTPINFEIINVGYTNNLGAKLSMEAGVKGTFSEFTNDVTVKRSINGEMRIDPEFTNESNLDEKILAAYLSWKWQPHDRWNLNGGLRYEYTDTYLSTPTQEALVDREFGNLFPSLFVTYNLNEDSKIRMSYHKRITRPTFNEMAPFVFFVGPNTFVAGNLSLKPAISDGVGLNYQMKQWWISLEYNYSKDDLAFFQPEFNPETNEQIFRSQNLKYMETYGIGATLPLDINSWWEVQNHASLYFHEYETQHLDNNVHGNVKRLTINVNNTFKLPREFTFELSGYYQSAALWGISRFRPLGKLNFGIRKKLKNDAVITLSVNDLFNNSIEKVDTEASEASPETYMLYNWGARSINLTFSHNFGNKGLKAVNIKSRSEAERNRVQ